MDTLKQLLVTRGAQLGARYVGIGLAALATKLGVELQAGQAESAAAAIAALAIGGLCLGADLVIHKIRGDKKDA